MSGKLESNISFADSIWQMEEVITPAIPQKTTWNIPSDTSVFQRVFSILCPSGRLSQLFIYISFPAVPSTLAPSSLFPWGSSLFLYTGLSDIPMHSYPNILMFNKMRGPSSRYDLEGRVTSKFAYLSITGFLLCSVTSIFHPMTLATYYIQRYSALHGRNSSISC